MNSVNGMSADDHKPICPCNSIRKSVVVKAIQAGANTFAKVESAYGNRQRNLRAHSQEDAGGSGGNLLELRLVNSKRADPSGLPSMWFDATTCLSICRASLAG